MGTPAAAVASLHRLVDDGHEIAAVYTQPDRPAGRGKQLRESPVKIFAKEHGIEVRQPLKIKTEETLDAFRALAADAAVVVAYGRILPQGFLDAFPMGAINVHFSLLPKYRGAAPVNWAIVNRETETGVTTMQMDAGLDTGPMLLQRSTPIGDDENAVELMARLAEIGAELISETLASYATLTPTSQDDSRATLAPMLKKEDGLIDWTASADDIAARVRGFQPFPTAYTTLDGKRLTVWKCKPTERTAHQSPAGEVIEASGDELLVSCGGGVLALEELQLEGKRRMSARDLLNGTRIERGILLG